MPGLPDNPIARRHANRTDTSCPVFWRRIGMPFAWFIALYMWAFVICVEIVLPYISYYIMMRAMLGPPLGQPPGVYEGIMEFVEDGLSGVGFLLLLIGAVLYSLMAIAVRRGQVRTRTFVVCLATAVLPFLLASWSQPLLEYLIIWTIWRGQPPEW